MKGWLMSYDRPLPQVEEIDTYYFSKEDKSQEVNYQNPLFYCLKGPSIYPYDDGFYIPEHWHEDLEYLYVIEGSLNYTVNDEKFVLHKNEGIIVNSKRIHSNNSPKGEYCLFAYALIHPSYISTSPYIDQKYTEPIIGPGSFDYLLLNDNDWTKPILEEIRFIAEKDNDEDGDELEIIERSYRILRHLYKHFKNEVKCTDFSGEYDTSYRNMLSFVHQNYSKKISVDDIACAGNVGRTLCTNLFKRFAYETPGDYLINYRISRGLELLCNSSMSISEIASAVGFTGTSHFTKTFREITGCTPKKYRQSRKIVN